MSWTREPYRADRSGPSWSHPTRPATFVWAEARADRATVYHAIVDGLPITSSFQLDLTFRSAEEYIDAHPLATEAEVAALLALAEVLP